MTSHQLLSSSHSLSSYTSASTFPTQHFISLTSTLPTRKCRSTSIPFPNSAFFTLTTFQWPRPQYDSFTRTLLTATSATQWPRTRVLVTRSNSASLMESSRQSLSTISWSHSIPPRRRWRKSSWKTIEACRLSLVNKILFYFSGKILVKIKKNKKNH